eukprot:875247-Pelagomonas_calceolata.AAC.1
MHAFLFVSTRSEDQEHFSRSGSALLLPAPPAAFSTHYHAISCAIQWSRVRQQTERKVQAKDGAAQEGESYVQGCALCVSNQNY